MDSSYPTPKMPTICCTDWVLGESNLRVSVVIPVRDRILSRIPRDTSPRDDLLHKPMYRLTKKERGDYGACINVEGFSFSLHELEGLCRTDKIELLEYNEEIYNRGSSLQV